MKPELKVVGRGGSQKTSGFENRTEILNRTLKHQGLADVDGMTPGRLNKL